MAASRFAYVTIMADKRVSLKLLIDNQKRRVLFAEGGKDFIDFLFTILTLPLGTVAKLLTKSEMVGSLGKLYESVENLNQTYMQPGQTKDTLLSPKTFHFNPKTPLLRSDSGEYSAFTFFKCSNSFYFDCSQYVSSSPKAMCPSCKGCIAKPLKYVAPPTGTGVADCRAIGYVKETITYLIMDDPEVQPMSTISAITLLDRFNIKDIGAVEEKVFDVGMDEALELLKASLQSRTVLTDVFLGRKEPGEEKRRGKKRR